MSKNAKIVVGVVVAALIIVGAYLAYDALSGGYGDNGTQDDEEERVAAPDFSVVDADGNPVNLSDFFGKPIVVNFWASWCPPCKAELPDFEKVYTEMKDDVVFLMVNMTDGQRETVEKASTFLSENGYTFPVYYDTGQDAAYTYGIQSIPTTLFIDKDGKVASGKQGMLNESTLRRGIALIQE